MPINNEPIEINGLQCPVIVVPFKNMFGQDCYTVHSNFGNFNVIECLGFFRAVLKNGLFNTNNICVSGITKEDAIKKMIDRIMGVSKKINILHVPDDVEIDNLS